MTRACDGRQRRSRVVAALAVGPLLGALGCASYAEAPLEPQRIEAAYDARTLDDPRLSELALAVLPGHGAFPPRVWTVDDWIVAALYLRSEVQAALAAETVHELDVQVAERRPNPTIGLALEFVGNSASEFAPWLLGLTSTWTMETAGKLDLRVAVAELEVRRARSRTLEVARTIVGEVESACASVASADGVLAAVERARSVAEGRVALSKRLVEAGEVARHVASDAELALLETSIELERCRTEAVAARVALASAIGLQPDAISGREFAAPAWVHDAPPAAAARTLGLRSRSDLRDAALDFLASDLALRSVLAAQVPNIELAPGFSWDQGERKFALGASFELPLFDDHSASIAAAEARRELARARFAEVQERAIHEIETRRSDYERAEVELDGARLLAAAGRERARTAARRVALGESDRLEELDAEFAAARADVELARTESRVLAARGVFQRALGRRWEGADIAESFAGGRE